MAEKLHQTTERGLLRRTADKFFLGISLITLPLGIYAAGTSFLSGALLRGTIASGFAFMDYTQIKEHGEPLEKQSWYNPERIMDKILGTGSNRFKGSQNTRIIYATS